MKFNLKYTVPKEISILFHNGSERSQQENFKSNLLLLKKTLKMHNLFSSNKNKIDEKEKEYMKTIS